jgi:hypothetical protein
MPRSLRALLQELERDGHFVNITNNPLAQFGRGNRRYIGAELLPERTVRNNAFREEAVRYRTIVANDGTRYSPVQKKKGELIGSMLVELGEADIGREISSYEYDTLVEELGINDSLPAMTRVLDWADTTLNGALIEHNERQRWQAIVSAVVQRRGSNGYSEDVAYPNPSGHRVNASVVWSNDANDPLDSDIIPIADMLAGKGLTVVRIIIPRPVLSILAGNAKMQARVGSVVVNVGGQLSIAAQRANLDQLGRIFQANGLPTPETYDLQYRTQTGTGYFLARNVMTFVCATGRDERLDLGDSETLIQDTLGYMAIGRAAGQATPGRVLRTEAFENKPPRVEGEAWETELPVITEPEALAVIGGIS